MEIRRELLEKWIDEGIKVSKDIMKEIQDFLNEKNVVQQDLKEEEDVEKKEG